MQSPKRGFVNGFEQSLRDLRFYFPDRAVGPGLGVGLGGYRFPGGFREREGKDREALTLLCAFEPSVTPWNAVSARVPPRRALRGTRLWAHLTRRRLKSHLARGQAPCRYAEPATPVSVTRL